MLKPSLFFNLIIILGLPLAAFSSPLSTANEAPSIISQEPHSLTISNLTSLHTRTIRVPDSQTVIKIIADHSRRAIDPTELRSLLRLAQGTVQLDIRDHGPDTLLPLVLGLQTFVSVGWHEVLTVGSWNHPPYFTYQQLSEVIEGLEIFMNRREHNYEAMFIFFNGQGAHPEYGIALGGGCIQRDTARIEESARSASLSRGEEPRY